MVMVSTEINHLKVKINQLQKELIRIAEESGLNSQEMLYCSQTLDFLIVSYQKQVLQRKVKNR